MYIRKKIYYPKSKIITNLYTTGKEWMFEDGKEYVGFYHKYLDGVVLSESVYSETKSKKLIPYQDQTQQPYNLIYDKLTEKKPIVFSSPVNVFVKPTLEDYEKGFFKRHFIYRRNLRDVLKDFYEVDIEQYKTWKKPDFGIDEKLYNAFIIDWKLTGPLRDVVVDGQIKEFGVYDTNRRLVYLFNNDYPKITYILTDYIEHSIYSKLTPEEIRKQFGN